MVLRLRLAVSWLRSLVLSCVIVERTCVLILLGRIAHGLLVVLRLRSTHVRIEVGGGRGRKRSVKSLRGGEELRVKKVKRVLLRLVEWIVGRTWMRCREGA